MNLAQEQLNRNDDRGNSPLPNSFWLPSRGTIGLLQVDPEKFDPTESSKLHLVTPTAMRLLLTEPLFLAPPLLKCSITSQLDFLGKSVPVVVAKLAAIAEVIWLIRGDCCWCCEWTGWPPHPCNSMEFWAVLVCLSEAARRVNPIFLLLPSCGTEGTVRFKERRVKLKEIKSVLNTYFINPFLCNLILIYSNFVRILIHGSKISKPVLLVHHKG